MPPGLNAEPPESWNKCPVLPELILIFYVPGSAACWPYFALVTSWLATDPPSRSLTGTFAGKLMAWVPPFVGDCKNSCLVYRQIIVVNIFLQNTAKSAFLSRWVCGTVKQSRGLQRWFHALKPISLFWILVVQEELWQDVRIFSHRPVRSLVH